jgi:hypothetical protein
MTMGQGAHHLGTSPAPAARNSMSEQRIGASSLPAPPLVTTRPGPGVLAQGAARRSRGQHEATAHDQRQATHVIRGTGALAWTNPDGQSQYRDFVPCSAVPGAIAPRPDDPAAMHNLPQRDFRLNLRPGGARRLSEAGRHWAPITRQRAAREERQSGLAWPTYCDKPKRRRLSWTAWGALSLWATVAVHRKMNSCIWHFSSARPLAAPVALPVCRGHLRKT